MRNCNFTKSKGESAMNLPTRYLLLIIFVIAQVCFSTGLWGTQPFWSMEPSTMEVSRADSLTGFDILKYDISLDIDDVSHYINGRVIATVLAEENLEEIQYRLTGGSLAVTEVLVNGVLSSFLHQDGIITIPLSVSQGTEFSTSVSYSGIPGNSPAPYNIGLKFTSASVYTLSNPDAGRYYWPSYDHPWDKALVDWHITVRQDWLAAANGVRSGITDNGDGTRTHHWVCAFPVATYVMGFAAAAYVEFLQQAGDIPIQNFVLPGQLNNASIDFANVPLMIDWFSSLFGPYPFEKYGHMVVNMSTYAAMEHQTMTTFGAQYLDGQQGNESIVAHELAHQWYGNYLTPITMREVWLKESFATYSEALWVTRKSGWEAACDYIRDSIQNYYISWENSNGPHTIFNPEYNLMFAPPTYEKSASVLHMLRLKMGNEAFFPFIRGLLSSFPNGNLNTAEFISLAQQYSGLDLGQFFQQWIYSPGIPELSYSIFSSADGIAKVYARSISPTATNFYLDIPLSLPGSAVADSVVIVASPEGQANYFAIGPNDDLSSLRIDPNNWVLLRQKTEQRMQLNSCLPYNSAVSLSWTAFAVNFPLIGYNVFRRISTESEYQCLNANPISGTSYTDTNVVNGTAYTYYVRAVDAGGYFSLPSNSMDAVPLDFPFDLGFLVIDETRDGTGTAISPTDQMVDNFYSSALEGFSFSQWDYALQGAPSLSELSHYPLILWHADDFSEMQLLQNLDLIGSYILSGGKILISGWKHPSVFTPGFLSQFMPGISLNYNNSAALISVQSSTYPTMEPDPAKLASAWNGMLPMVFTFPGAQNVLYTAQMTESVSGNTQAAVIRIEAGGSMVLTGFPLYFMQAEAAKGFLQNVLPQLLPPVDPIDPYTLPVSLFYYPNPFSGAVSLKLSIKHALPQKLELFNLRGQKLVSLDLVSPPVSLNEILLDIPAGSFQGLASACYFLRLSTDRGVFTRKMVLLR